MMKKIKTLFIIAAILSTSCLFAQFPQEQVDNKYYQQLNDLRNIKPTKNNQQELLKKNNHTNTDYSNIHGENDDIDIKLIKELKSTLTIGLDDTVLINTDTYQNSNIYLEANGVLIVDNATLELYGHLLQIDSSEVYIINGAYLHVLQEYNAQFMHVLHNDSYFETSNSKIFANTVYQIRHFDNSEYIATNTDYPNWDFHVVCNKSKWTIEGVDKVGDMTINDSSQVHFIKCDTIMPWFGVPDGGNVNIVFPDYKEVEHYVFDENLTGVSGVDIKVTFDTCSVVMWGFDSWPGSNINVYNSNWSGVAFRIYEDATIKNVYDYTSHDYFDMPLTDRTYTLTNSYFHFWFPYVYDDAVVYIDSSQYAESKAHNNAKIYITNTDADGFPSCGAPVDDGFMSIENGRLNTFTSSWHNSTFYHSNLIVIPKECSSQDRNIAHHNSYFLAVNSYYEYEPEAMGASLVMFAVIDSLDTAQINTNIDISGSAWIDAGVDNNPMITFDRYKLYYCIETGTDWTLIDESTSQVHHNLLSTWNTTGLTQGDYIIKLTVWDNEGDSLSALRPISLINSTTDIDIPQLNDLFSIYPNPANEYINIVKNDNLGEGVEIRIFNNVGQVVHNNKYAREINSIAINISNYTKGLYYVKITENNQVVVIKKIVIQ